MLYFSYAANLNRSHMARLCPGAEPLYSAVLADYTLTVRRWFNVERGEGSLVYGGVWRIGERHLEKLDWYEDWPELYEKRTVEVIPVKHGSLGAWEQGRRTVNIVSEYIGVGENAEHLLALSGPVKCLVYIMKEPFVIPPSPPDPEYLEMVRQGYRDWGLPGEQLDSFLD